MSPSKAFKKYVKKLASSGLPTCKATLANLAQMGDVEAFQWFMANKYQPVVDHLASNEDTTSTFVQGILDAPDDEDDEDDLAALTGDPQASILKLEKLLRESQPKAKRGKAKATAKASTGDTTWRQGIYARYGITPEVGASFQSKHGTTFVVTEVFSDHVRAARIA